MSDEFLGKKVTIVDGPTKSPFFVWHPDILLRLNDFCASPNLFAEGEISGGYVRDMLRDARDEIERLRLAIRRLAEQDATLSVVGGNVIVEMDALTDEEREAVENALAFCERTDKPLPNSDQMATLRGLLDRTKGGTDE